MAQRLQLLLLSLPLLSAAPQPLPHLLPAASATWHGRTLSPSPTNVSFSWEGVSARFTVTGGTTVVLNATSGCPGSALFHTLIDGALHSNWTLTKGGLVDFVVAEGLDPGVRHEVVLWYATDPISLSWDRLPFWLHTFNGFSSDGVLSPTPPSSRRLLIIGDSISAGNQISNATCGDDHWGSYGARLCEHFGADCQTAAVSGKGLYVSSSVASLSPPTAPALNISPNSFTPANRPTVATMM